MANPSISTNQFPHLALPLVDDSGLVARPWQRFLQNLWLRTGAGAVNNQNFVFLTLGNNGTLVVNGTGGNSPGNIEFTNVAGKAAAPVVVGASPFKFATVVAGSLGVESGQVELSRDGGVTWYVVGLAGGLLPLRAFDQVRITYYHTAPKVTFFPD